MRTAAGSAVLIGVLAGLILTAAAVGPLSIPLDHTFTALLDWAGVGDSSATRTEQAVIESIRLPRIVLAVFIGYSEDDDEVMVWS